MEAEVFSNHSRLLSMYQKNSPESDRLEKRKAAHRRPVIHQKQSRIHLVKYNSLTAGYFRHFLQSILRVTSEQ